MNIVILTDQKQYTYHSSLAQMMGTLLAAQTHNVSILDINSKKYDHECLAQLKTFNPHVIITLDLAGFRFKTQSGETALNMLFTKNLNLLWGNKPEYMPLLNRKISLSMLFYDATGTDYSLPKIYPNMLYYKSSKQPLSVSFTDDSKNAAAFQNIWHDFLKEALLSET